MLQGTSHIPISLHVGFGIQKTKFGLKGKMAKQLEEFTLHILQVENDFI